MENSINFFFETAPKVSPGCFKGVSKVRVSQGCLKSVSRVSQECLKCAPRVLQECF